MSWWTSSAIFFRVTSPQTHTPIGKATLNRCRTLSADSPERMDVMFVDKLLLEDHLHWNYDLSHDDQKVSCRKAEAWNQLLWRFLIPADDAGHEKQRHLWWCRSFCASHRARWRGRRLPQWPAQGWWWRCPSTDWASGGGPGRRLRAGRWRWWRPHAASGSWRRWSCWELPAQSKGNWTLNPQNVEYSTDFKQTLVRIFHAWPFTTYLPTYMMEVAVMSHMAGGKKRSGLKLWPGFILGSWLCLSRQSKMWKTARQLSSPRNIPTACAATREGGTEQTLINSSFSSTDADQTDIHLTYADMWTRPRRNIYSWLNLMADCRFCHTSPVEMGERIDVPDRHGNPWQKTCQPICQTKKDFSWNTHSDMVVSYFPKFLWILSLGTLTKLCLSKKTAIM